MNDEIYEAVKNDSVQYFKEKIIKPSLEIHLKYNDDECFEIFTQDLADIFDEYQPNYFADEHSKYVGQYFYSSLYGDALPEEMLIEIIKADEHEKFNGLEVYFEDFSSMDYQVSRTVENYSLDLNFVKELFILFTLKNLNKQR